MKALMLRGLTAGAIGGAVSGVFLLLVTEPLINRALAFEHATGLAAPGGEAEMFSRGTQTVGGFIASVLFGIFLGALLAVLFALTFDRLGGQSHTERLLKLATAAFLVITLLPGLKYPPNPPSVGNGDTIGQRTTTHAILIGLCGLVVWGTWWLWGWATRRGMSPATRLIAVGGGAVVVLAITFAVVPSNPDRTEAPLNEAAPALQVAADAPPRVLRAMLAAARASGTQELRDPKNPDLALDVDKVASATDLRGAPVRVSTASLVPTAFTDLVWRFRLASFIGLALLWASIAASLAWFLERLERQGDPLLNAT